MTKPHWIPIKEAPIVPGKLYFADFNSQMMGPGTVKEEKGERKIEWTWTFKGLVPTHYWSF